MDKENNSLVLVDSKALLAVFRAKEQEYENKAAACRQPPRDMVAQGIHAGFAAGMRSASEQVEKLPKCDLSALAAHWRAKAESINRQLEFVGASNPLGKDAAVLKQCANELEAAMMPDALKAVLYLERNSW